jgi:hypothetical protein
LTPAIELPRGWVFTKEAVTAAQSARAVYDFIEQEQLSEADDELHCRQQWFIWIKGDSLITTSLSGIGRWCLGVWD